MHFYKHIFSVLAGLALSGLSAIEAKDVFCHYMVGTVDSSTNHAQLDIEQAAAMGLSAFALNVGAPTASWCQSTVEQLFNYANSNNFKLFFSLDLGQDGTLTDFTSLVQQYINNTAYYKAGPNNYPFLSTYSAGSTSPSDWASFKSSLGTNVYFVPDFDGVSGYYTDINSFFSTWGSTVDGVFSWETAWPAAQTKPANVSTDSDQYVQTGTQANSKSYMIPLSSLQYKHLDSGTNYYRVGEVNLPQRMTEILDLGKTSGTVAPDFVEVITWNDAGESHYIGNLWAEGIPADELAYANQTGWPHSGWQPLITSFIDAYKNGDDSSAMAPPSGSAAVGAMWYRTIWMNATCASDPYGKPTGWQAAQDAVNFAVVVAAGQTGLSIRVTSGGTILQTIPVSPGLNYGSVPGLQLGTQKVELINSSGSAILTANSAIDVTADTTTGICNFNYQVAALQ
jgi:glucan endo-1,3-alpha-glucosidase